MNKIIPFGFLMLCAALAYAADTYTTNYSLRKPDLDIEDEETPWGEKYDTTMDLIDSVIKNLELKVAHGFTGLSSNASQFSGNGISTAPLTLLASSVTLQGNDIKLTDLANKSTFQYLNKIHYADQFTGADIGAKINNAFDNFGSTPTCGTVEIPMGTYSFSTTIEISSVTRNRTGCWLRGQGNNTVLVWTGTGSAITSFIGNYEKLSNFKLTCSGTGCTDSDGITIENSFWVDIGNVEVTGFSNGHSGIHFISNSKGVFGANTFGHDLHDSYITSCSTGILADGENGTGLAGTVIRSNRIDANNNAIVVSTFTTLTISDNIIQGYPGWDQVFLKYGNVLTFSGNHIEQDQYTSTGSCLRMGAGVGAIQLASIRNNLFLGGYYCVEVDTHTTISEITWENNFCAGSSNGLLLEGLTTTSPHGITHYGVIKQNGELTSTSIVTPLLTSTAVVVTGDTFSVGGSTLVVDNGNVGIGLAAPEYSLDVGGVSSRFRSRAYIIPETGTNGAYLTFQNDGGGAYVGISSNSTGSFFDAYENPYWMNIAYDPGVGLQVGGVHQLPEFVVNPDGNVGIGTTAPASKLSIVSLPASAGAGGEYVCVDSSGNLYKKSVCP